MYTGCESVSVPGRDDCMKKKVQKSRLFFNRELSWLAFNHRVFEIALDAATPLFERLKFLSIVSSNLDEFYMVRVGGLQSMVNRRKTSPDISGMTPHQQLDEIGLRVHAMVEELYRCYCTEVQPALDDAGFRRCRMNDLAEQETAHLERYFNDTIFPVLTPVAITPDIVPIPLIAGRRLHLAVRLKPVERQSRPRYAFLPMVPALNRFIPVPSVKNRNRFILVEDVIRHFIDRLFPGERIMECIAFRITRNADMAVREDLAADLMAEMEQVIDDRKRSEVIRLEYAVEATGTMQTFLKRIFSVDSRSVFPVNGPLDFASFFSLCSNENDQLIFPRWTPKNPLRTKQPSTMFELLRRYDRLFYHPYDSFEPVLRFLEEAADDPDVIAIKQVMYRNSRNSPLLAALKRAAENGKAVTVLMELKARFDEERNIYSARELEDSGVQVIYGVHGLKTHAKICLVVRREPEGIMRYAHFGTGNYNEATARLYTDVGYMTTNKDLCSDASGFFNVITGYSQPIQFRKIAMAPMGLRDRILELINTEIRRCKEKQKTFIKAKMNSLVDPHIINALYEASRAGVTVDLNVRGICCLRPGIKGFSENIRVISIIDRYLEHSRIFCFCSGGEHTVYISSADWMPRNLDRRVELLVPVENGNCREYLLKHLDLCFRDNANAWALQTDGQYRRLTATGKRQIRSQQEAYRMVEEKTRAFDLAERSKLVPRLPKAEKNNRDA